MTRNEVLALKPGTWLELKWNDSPNTIVLLIKDVDVCPGDMSLCVYDHNSAEVSNHPIHTQIVRVVGTLEIPKIM